MSVGTLHLTIDDRAIVAEEGLSLLEVSRRNGIEVPTLCHHEGLRDVGACRLCIVEIEGLPRPVTSCTTPAEEGMCVRTNTPNLYSLRRQTLELIFGERNHICPFCPRSGNCELQSAAYAHRMDHVRYDYVFPKLNVDNSHAYISLDHNRCILCTRCVRACDEWVGAHVFSLDGRGYATRLIADSGVPFGESSCVSCGTCVSVCPTGALFEKRCAHWQGRVPRSVIETICPACGVGCRIHASVRHGQLGELASAGGPGGNRLLCDRGRFGLVNPAAARVRQPRIKRGRAWNDASLTEVLSVIARRLDGPQIQADPDRVVGFFSPRLPLETLTACQSFLTDAAGSRRWALADRSRYNAVREALGIDDVLPPLAGLNDLDDADMILLLGCNLVRSHGVVGSYVRRAVRHRGAKLVKINPQHTWLTRMTDLSILVERGRDHLVLSAMLKYLIESGSVQVELPKDLVRRLDRFDDGDITAATRVPAEKIRQAAEFYSNAHRPMILCGRGVTRQTPEALRAALALVQAADQKTSSGRWRLMELAVGAVSAGARLLGSTPLDIDTFDPHSADVAFVAVTDDDPTWPRDWLNKLRTVPYVVVLAAREHEVCELAHVVVPVPAWPEREGTFLNLEGRVQKAVRLMAPQRGCIDEVEFFATLAKAWRGTTAPPVTAKLPAGIDLVADRHMGPCASPSSDIDLSGLEALVAD